MSTNHSRQLIEHISDQYVLSALDAEQAFAREAQKRKKNRKKILSIACATAAVYAIIIVSIILGTRPDNPPEPPTPGTPGSQNGGGIDVTLPDAEFFQQHLSGFWEPNTSVSEPYPDTDLSSSTSVLNFQSDGRVYIMDLTSSSTTLGKYSVAGDFIQIYTLDAEQTWVQSGKMKLALQSDQALLQAGSWTYKRITGTETTNLLICGVSESTETEISIWDFYIEDVRFKDHSVHLYVSAAEFCDLAPLRFDSAPTFFVNLVDNVKYKIYDKRMTLLEEGAQKFDIEDNSLSLDLLEEHGLYYIDLSGMYTSSGPIQEVVLHYYLAIQVGEPEPEPDEPVTPPEYTPPEITLPDEPYLDYIRCMGEIYGMWTDGSWMEGSVKDVIYYFSPGGYFYEMNIKTRESMMGVYYYYADGTILLFEANEKGDPVRQLPRHAVRSGGDNGVITVINTEDGKTLGTYTLGNTMPTTELLRVEIDKKSYLIPHMFPESFVWDEDHKFEFDTAFFVDKMQSVTHLTVTEAPILYIPLQGKGATYTLYIKEPGTSTLEVLDEGILIQEHGKMTLPDISGLYWDDDGVCLYLDIRFETDGYNAYCNQQFMHYFVALRCGEEEEAPSYTPPVLDDDRDILPITNCDVAPGGMFTLDTTSPAEGRGCWSTTMAPAIAFQKLETAINATGCDVIEFDLYISDLGALEVMKQNCALELSSGGQPDVQEIAFSGRQIVEFGRYGQEWKVGWNRVVLRLSDATPTNTSGNASFDISSINYVRFYLLSASSGHTIKIDNICLSGKVTASEKPTTPPDQPIETPDYPIGDTTGSVEIFDCDTLPDYHGDFELDQTNMVEGDGCISITVTGTTYTIMDLTFDPINAEGCDVLEFDLYISDPALFQSGRFFTIELSSSVKQNTAELVFSGAGFFGLYENLELKQGWNHVKIRLSEGKLQYIEEQGFDLGAINHLHIFLIENRGAPNGEYTVKIDNVCLSKEVK